eukprot:g24135.t1
MNRRSEPKDQPTDGRDRPTRHRAEPTTNDDSRRFKQRPERPERPDGGMINDVPVVVSSFGTQLVSSSGGTSGFRAPSIGRSGGLAGVACGGLALVPLRCLLTLTQGRRVQRRRRRGRILFANPAVRNGTNHSPNARFDPGREALPPNFTSEARAQAVLKVDLTV